MRIRGFAPSTPCWVELTMADPVRAAGFYSSVFGWALTDEFGSGEWLTEAHDSVAGLITGRPGARWQPSFQVADAQDAINRCADLGGRVIAGPMEMGLGSYVEIIDP